MKDKFKLGLLLFIIFISTKVSASADTFVLRPESFFDIGTWISEVTSEAFSGISLKGAMDKKTVNTKNARAKFNVTEAGDYNIYVRTRDFATYPGQRTFQLEINGQLDDFIFGNLGFDGWGWQEIVNIPLNSGENILELVDTSAYYARVDAIIISSGVISNLPTSYDSLLKIGEPLYPFEDNLKLPAYAQESGTVTDTKILENSYIALTFYEVMTSGGRVIQLDTTIKDKSLKTDSRTDGFGYLLLTADSSSMSTSSDMFPVWTQKITSSDATYKITTNNTYKSGIPYWMIPNAAVKDGNTVILTAENERAVIESEWVLNENEREPKVTVRLTPKSDGAYSVGAFNGKAITKEQADFILNPFRINNNRFSAEPGMTTEAFSTAALSQVTYKIGAEQITKGVAADPASLTHVWVSSNTPKFGLTTLDYYKNARPAIFFPVMGTEQSEMKADNTFSFSYRPVSVSGGWYNGYSHTVNDIFKLTDYRKNYYSSLTDAAFNMHDLLKNDWFSGWDVNAKAHYNMEGRNIVTNSDPLAYFQFYLLTEDKELLERRTIPNLAYLLSRTNTHFKYSTYQEGSTYYFGDDGIVGVLGAPQTGYGTATFGGAYKMTRKLIPSLKTKAFPADGKPNTASVGSSIGNVSKMSEYVWKYRYTGNQSDLNAAIIEADSYINQRLNTKQSNYPADNTFINLDYYPYWSGLLDLYEVTNNKKYLDAAEEGARQMMTTIWTQPLIPDEDIFRNGQEAWDHGIQRKGTTLFFHGDKRFRVGVFSEFEDNYPVRPIADYSAPSWVPSRVGIGIEQTSTFRGAFNSNIIMTTWVPDLLRLSQYTANGDYEKYARIAQIGRYSNYPGYYQSSLDSYNMTPGFPYTGPDFSSIYYHHIPVLLSQVQDFLITQAWNWSDGKISFPSVRQQGYVWFNSRHYGFEAGSFFSENEMWPWLKRGLITVDNMQIDWIGARKDGVFACALMNEDTSDIDVTVTLGKEVDPKNEITETVVYYPDGSSEVKEVINGQLCVTVAGKGLTGLKFSAPFVKKPSAARINPDDYANSGVNSTLIKSSVDSTNYAIGEVLQMEPDNYYAHVYLTNITENPDHTKNADTVSEAVLNYSTDGENYTQLRTADFPLEFIVKVDNSKNKFYYNLDVYDGLGNKIISNDAGGVLEPLYKRTYSLTPLTLLETKIIHNNNLISYIPYNQDLSLKFNLKNTSISDIKNAWAVLTSEEDNRLTYLSVLPKFSISKNEEFEISVDVNIPKGNVSLYIFDGENSLRPLIDKIKLQ